MLAPADKGDLGLPAQLRLDVLEALDVGRVRDDDVPALGGGDRAVALPQLDLEPQPLGVLASEGERVGRDVDADDLSVGPLVLERECDRARADADVEDPGPLASATSSARSTSVSVSGRGTSARASVISVSRRKPHSPSTYARGSRASRRERSGSRPSTSSSRCAASPERVVRRRCATSHSASTRGVFTPAAASRCSASASASRTVTPRASGGDRRSRAPR